MNQTSTSSDPEAQFKEEAAKRAVQFVQSGMKVGLGTGSTAIFATRRIAELLKTGELSDIVAFATSKATAEEAVRLGIPMLPDDLPEDLDVTIDGADEVDPEMNLIKGGGGIDSFWNIVFAAPPSGTVLAYFLGAILSVRTEAVTYGLWVYDPNSSVNKSGLKDPFADGVTIQGASASRSPHSHQLLRPSTARHDGRVFKT